MKYGGNRPRRNRLGSSCPDRHPQLVVKLMMSNGARDGSPRRSSFIYPCECCCKFGLLCVNFIANFSARSRSPASKVNEATRWDRRVRYGTIVTPAALASCWIWASCSSGHRIVTDAPNLDIHRISMVFWNKKNNGINRVLSK